MNEIAILLAVYNGERYLAEQLDSLLDQSYQNLHIYIHDDGSKDHSMDIIQAYQSNNPQKITVLDHPSMGGACANFMSMLRYANEPYVMFCDQDDVWLPNKVERVYREMKTLEKQYSGIPCLVFSDLYVVDDTLNIISDSFMRYAGRNPYCTDYKSLIMKNVAPGCTMLLNRVLVNRVIQCADINRIGMHDSWTILVASLLGKICFVNEPLSKYRQHQGNVVGAEAASVWQKTMSNLKYIFSGEQGRQKREWLDSVSDMAAVLIQSFALKPEDMELLTKMAAIRGQSKNKRIQFYYQNGFIKMKRWWLAIWV